MGRGREGWEGDWVGVEVDRGSSRSGSELISVFMGESRRASVPFFRAPSLVDDYVAFHLRLGYLILLRVVR